ncbi:MAG: IS200/IS605 family transposase [Candidatus Electrothrix communis]|nr:MAG: IS200/IS605 family transposase [Candidatus Electrothrix communis]
MSHSYISCHIQYVFSTKGREPWITPDIHERLFTYMNGTAQKNNMASLRVGGTEDHVHQLVSLPATLSIAKAVQLIKGNSSKWIHETFSQHRHFYWQEGYGAFSVSVSQIERIIAYIDNQQEHHRFSSFEEEFLLLLKKHRTEYDEQYVFG